MGVPVEGAVMPGWILKTPPMSSGKSSILSLQTAVTSFQSSFT